VSFFVRSVASRIFRGLYTLSVCCHNGMPHLLIQFLWGRVFTSSDILCDVNQWTVATRKMSACGTHTSYTALMGIIKAELDRCFLICLELVIRRLVLCFFFGTRGVFSAMVGALEDHGTAIMIKAFCMRRITSVNRLCLLLIELNHKWPSASLMKCPWGADLSLHHSETP